MCLSVYVGSHAKLDWPSASIGNLDAEKADWTPPPLARFEHIYHLGRRGERGVECSCLLAEFVDFDDRWPKYRPDDLLVAAAHDPFVDLQNMARSLISDSDPAIIGIACDGDGGVPSLLSNDDYDVRYLPVQEIKRGSMLFSDGTGSSFGVRAYYVFDPSGGAPVGNV